MNDFSIGRDISVDIFGQVNGVVKPDLVLGFDRKQLSTKVTIKGMDGITRYLELPDGWEGSIEIARKNNTMDDYFASLEAQYYAGKNTQPAIITETISEPDGSISQYRYEGVYFKYDDAGAWKGDSDVKQKLSWCASKRRKVV